MIVVEIIVRVVGVLFLLGALAVLRAMKVDSMLDAMLAGISGKPAHPREAVRRRLLLAGSVLSGLAGAAMVTLSLWSLPLLAASAVAQGLWLFWARGNYPPEDDDERRGRQQSRNAAIFTLAMFALTLGLGLDRRLIDWGNPVGPGAIGLATVLGLAYFFGDRLRKPRGEPDLDMQEPEPDIADTMPVRVRLAPAHNCPSLYDADTYASVPPHRFLGPTLADRIQAWEERFHDEARQADDGEAEFASAAALAAFHAEGEAIVAELRSIFGPDNVEGPFIHARAAVG